jgi:selenocysteine lyase/cysteine desulfurase
MDGKHSVDWRKVRQQFPYLQETVHLNAAGMTPLPRPVYEAGKSVLDQMHLHTKDFADQLFMQNVIAHQAVAKFYNVNPNDIALVQTSSLAMNILALHFSNRWRDKKKIITLEDEFPSSTLPWARHGFELEYVQPVAGHLYNVEDILSRVDTATVAVVASYVQFGTGVRLDITALGHALKSRNIPLVLNATQAAGVIPIDLHELPVDAMVASGNKWLMAGIGAGSLYVSEALRSDVFPSLVGWLSAAPIGFSNRLNQLNRGAASVELGLNSLVPIKCLEAATAYLQSIGIEAIHRRVLDLSTYLITSLRDCDANVMTPISESDRLGIVTVNRDDAVAWVERLKSKGIVVVLRGERQIRISPHIYNDEGDIDLLLAEW